MIVPSMSNLEICDALFADKPKVKIKADMLMPKIVKQFKKENRFPSWKWAEYTHQESHNKFLISFYAPTIKYADKPIIDYLSFIEENKQKIVVQWGCWMYKKNDSSTYIATRYIGYFSSHFFSRYRERIWKDTGISYNELVCRYFSRNTSTIPIELNESIKNNYKEYGEYAKYAFQVPDGTCFIKFWNEGDETTIGRKDSDFVSVVLYYTFVNPGMMSEKQNEAIKKEGSSYIINTYRKFLEDALTEEFIRIQNSRSELVNIKQKTE